MTGHADPAFASLDQIVQQFHADYPHGGAVAVSEGGCIVYQRGFEGMPENAPMRIASIEKAFTAAIVQQLVDEGILHWSDFAFDLDQPTEWLASEGRWRTAGILPYTPYGGLGDGRLRDVTIRHLFDHQGGWYRNESGDPMFEGNRRRGSRRSQPARRAPLGPAQIGVP